MLQRKECSGCTFCLSMHGFERRGLSVSLEYCYHKKALYGNGIGEVLPSLCEDMREAGADCGPEGHLWVEYINIPPILPAKPREGVHTPTLAVANSHRPKHLPAKNLTAPQLRTHRRPAPYKEGT